MWAIGVYDLGLDDKAFWRLTLKQFDLLSKRRRIETRRQEYNAAHIVWAVCQVHSKKDLKISDFMSKEQTAPAKEMSWKQMQQRVKILNRIFKGKTNGRRRKARRTIR